MFMARATNICYLIINLALWYVYFSHGILYLDVQIIMAQPVICHLVLLNLSYEYFMNIFLEFINKFMSI
jgi:hypothetical protein